jgi:sigma-E factor negative regulatory protein RseC
MEQLVRVKQVHSDGTATVMHIRESACSGDCHKCSGCGAAKEAIVLEAKNAIGAATGDLVKIESESGPVLKAAVVMYVVPMILFFVGYALGSLWNLGGLVGSVSFALSIGLIVAYDRKVVRHQGTEYTITKYAGK